MITRIGLALLLLSTSVLSFAGKVDLLMSLGPNFSRQTNNTVVQINPVVTNHYKTNVATQTEALAGLGVGHTYENIYHNPFNISLNLMGYYTNLGRIRGTEYPFANIGGFDTLNYKFSALSYSVMVEPRFIYTRYCLQPFLLAGIGAAWNRLQSYSEVPTDPSGSAAAAPQPFGNHTQGAFAYELGLGVQKPLFLSNTGCLKYFLSLDYRYMNFGNARLSNFPAMTSGDHLKISNLYTQAVVLTLKAAI